MKLVEIASNMTVEGVHKLIQRDCTQILEIYQNTDQMLWRGMTGDPMIVKKTIRMNRHPLEMGQIKHEAINKAIQNLGFVAHRGNSIFVTNNTDIAFNWGKPFIIFPHDGFKYLWFKNQLSDYMFDELHAGYSLAYDRATRNFNIKTQKKEFNQALIEYLSKEISRYRPTDKNLNAALEQPHREVLITGDYYYAIDRGLSEKVEQWF